MRQAGPSRRQLLTGTRAEYDGPIRCREGGHRHDTGRDPVLTIEHPRRHLNAAVASRPLRTGPLARCPGCGTPLDGGPVWYHCQTCRRAVPAADVDIDYHLPAGSAGA